MSEANSRWSLKEALAPANGSSKQASAQRWVVVAVAIITLALWGLLAESMPVGSFTGLAIAMAVACALAVIALRSRERPDNIKRVGSLFDALDEGILICHGLQIMLANTSFRSLVGGDKAEGADLLSSYLADVNVIDLLLGEGEVDLETELVPARGEAIAVEITAHTIDDGGVPARLLEIRDVRERRADQARIRFLAHHDMLTELPNREMLSARLDAAILRTRATEERSAVLWIDLDRFKEVNDIYGHAIGDKVLRAVARKLTFELPRDVLVARVGGDEFVVLLDGIAEPAEARLVGQQLRRMLNRPLQVGETSILVGASVGVAVFPDDASTGDELMRHADLALYQAKSEGRARCRHFTGALGVELQRRLKLGESLPAAIANGDIKLELQPTVRSTDFAISGFEALARWRHPEIGVVAPPDFVRLAEENGLIGALNEHVVREAIRVASAWPERTHVAVNVSPIQIRPDLVDQVRDIIRSTDFDPRRLELEVTENALIHDFKQAAGVFARLRGLGVQIAMDDFGAGFTSLGNLRRLNFDRVKIDKIFTDDLPSHRRSAAIVRSLFVLARELNLHITVEGVETVEQVHFLRQEGFCEIQGFFFSKPMPAGHWANVAGRETEFRTKIKEALASLAVAQGAGALERLAV